MGSVESFGTYLRHLRESKGLSLRQAAEAAQVSSGYLSQIEGGKRGKRRRGEHFAPHPQILKRLADVYHVPAQELFERAGFFESQEEYSGFSEEREVARCFDFVIHDPVFRRALSTQDKRAIIERYEALTGRRLITWAGDDSAIAKKSWYKGLSLRDGVLYANTVHETLTLEEVAQELGISVDRVRQLVRDRDLRLAPRAGDRIHKNWLLGFKSYVLKRALERWPREFTLEELKEEAPKQRAERHAGGPKSTAPDRDTGGAPRRSKTSPERIRASR